MGFCEDDRVRCKNKKVNQALDLYEDLKTMGYSNEDIVRHAEFAVKNSPDCTRNEVYLTMISIVGGFSEKDRDGNSNG